MADRGKDQTQRGPRRAKDRKRDGPDTQPPPIADALLSDLRDTLTTARTQVSEMGVRSLSRLDASSRVAGEVARRVRSDEEAYQAVSAARESAKSEEKRIRQHSQANEEVVAALLKDLNRLFRISERD